MLYLVTMSQGLKSSFPHGGAMQQLAGLDAAFLTLDSSTSYGHVGSVSVLDPPAGGEAAVAAWCRAGRGGFDYPVDEAGLSTELVVRRTAPQSPVPTPMTAPPRPISCCE